MENAEMTPEFINSFSEFYQQVSNACRRGHNLNGRKMSGGQVDKLISAIREHVWNTHVVPLLSDFESNQRSVYSLNGRCNQLDSENKALQEKLKIAEHLKELADDAIVTLQKEVEKLKADNESLLKGALDNIKKHMHH